MDHSTSHTNLSLILPNLPSVSTGGGGWSFHVDHPHEWCWQSGAFSETDLDSIIKIGESLQQADGLTGAGRDVEVRNSRVSWLFPNDITGWVFQRVEAVVRSINDQYYRFDLDGLHQGLQFTKYTAPGQHYTWHVDRGPRVGVRKLSFSLQLSSPESYDGGDLQLRFGDDDQLVPRQRGLCAVFPSWALHRVTPVTKGTRYSLVAWVSGPPFR